MSLIMEMVLEESRRNLAMQKMYEAEIAKLPKGTVTAKKVGRNEYFYLKYRDGKKTKTNYLGRDVLKVEEVKQQIQKRKHFEFMLSELKKESKMIMKVTGGSV